MTAASRPVALVALAARIHAELPQTQCRRCGYPDCAAYAAAIATADAPINQCPPGGATGIARLAALTGQAIVPLNPANGAESVRSVAVIDEAWCIGCTLCLEVCPTDAIFGSNKSMHTVIEPHCTGCELCIPVCPVDCIDIENVTGERTGWAAWSRVEADAALARYENHRARLRGTASELPSDSQQTAAKATSSAIELPPAGNDPAVASARKQSVIDAALARARGLRRPK